MIVYYLILFIILGSILTLSILNNIYKSEDRNNKILKILKVLAIVFVSMGVFNLLLPNPITLTDDNFDHVNYLKDYKFIVLLMWFNEVSCLILPFAVFFKNKKILTKIVAYFVIPVILLSSIFLFKFNANYNNLESLSAQFGYKGIANLYIMHNNFDNWFTHLILNGSFRTILFMLFLIIEFIVSIFIVLMNKNLLKFESKKEIFIFVIQLILLILTAVNLYVPRALFPAKNIYMKPFNIVHILWLVEIIVECIVVSKLAKKFNKEEQYILIFVLTLALIFGYNSMFGMTFGIPVKRWPLQLCNIAPLLLLLTLLTKKERLFHFTLVANITGALLAVIFLGNDPDYVLTYPWNVHFIIEHQNIIVAPILMLTTGMFKKLEKKDYKDAILGFLMYFGFVTILGIILNGINSITGDGYWYCNFFFIFDKERALDFLPFAGFLYDTKLVLFKHFTFTLAPLLVSAAFCALVTIIFFVFYYASNLKINKEIIKK